MKQKVYKRRRSGGYAVNDTVIYGSSIILKETAEAILMKFAPDIDFWVVVHKPSGRQLGLNSEKDAERFMFRRGWETSDAERLARRKHQYPELYAEVEKIVEDQRKIVVE